eukprot:TRINITY_DN6862_c0_g1_i2.p1 TRINITY_DN6862_c0_g1~~TRINITY_DN6862_c0_g1_i2.p1  ORF type:complete len:375 (-),score=77.43 TRINITY_DN6862_c0_g1_i2:98-1108(-)
MSESQTLKSPIFASFGTVPESDKKLQECLKSITELPPMDKHTMSGPCHRQTDTMEKFMKKNFGFKNTKGWFVEGVMEFKIDDISKYEPTKVVSVKSNGCNFQLTIEEILKWQKTYKCYYADDIFPGEEGIKLIQKSLRGQSEAGEEAWKMKFAVRLSKNPIFMYFDGKVINRNPGDAVEDNIFLVSVCGHDFAGRKHDYEDTTKYIKNWRQVYKTKNGMLIAYGRDFMPTGVAGELDEELLFKDLVKMARLRLRAQDKEGIQIVGETGIGLGVFSGDYIGIGGDVRKLAARALAEVLAEEKFTNIKAVVCALPIFRKVDNYHYFEAIFKKYYKGLF